MSQADDRWSRKTYAFLHDPPHKPLVLGQGHERIGADLARAWLGSDEGFARWHALAKRADHIASGADREGFLRQHAVDPRRELTLVHPLDGKPLHQLFETGPGSIEVQGLRLSADDAAAAHQSMVRAFESVGRWLSEAEATPAERYSMLWRLVPELLRAFERETGEGRNLGALWELLPADTRMPTHSVLGHCGLVAALTDVLADDGRASLLMVAVGPVQGFIASARRLSDLWAGSSLLSHAVWAGIQVVCEQLGPDHVVFPSLRGQPLFDRWLLGGVGRLKDPGSRPGPVAAVLDPLDESLSRRLRIPSLPNRFTAIVPRERAAEIGAACEQAIREFWTRTAARATREFGDEAPAILQQAERQAAELLEVTWAAAPWDAHRESLGDGVADRTPLGARSLVKDALEATRGLDGYQPNGGLLYGDAFAEVQRLLDAVKRSGCASPAIEPGLKCSLCGEREVLGTSERASGEGRVRERKQWWGKCATRLGKASLVSDRGEALCGPCWTKRWWGVEQPELRTEFRHPSTGELAASRFKLEVLRNVADDPELSQAVQHLTAAAREAAGAGALDRGDTHVWCPEAITDVARGEVPLAQLDGQHLLPSPREGASPEDEGLKGVRSAAREVRKRAEKLGIEPPRPYLAVIHLDGDRIGRWLGGELGPRMLEMLHPKLRSELPAASREKLERVVRRVTPSVHQAISEACATFSQVAAPLTIQMEGIPASLVYAGGDDALLLAPACDALELVRRLRLRFSGHPQGFGEAEDKPFGTPGWAAWSVGDTGRPRPPRKNDETRVGLVFGGKATASAGMCLFHFTAPLGEAIARAREAEHYAKEVVGRNALGIFVLRRSGQMTRCGLRFTDDGRGRDFVGSLRELEGLFRNGLSPRLVRQMRGTIEPILGGELGAQRLWEMAQQLGTRALLKREGVQAAEPAALGRVLDELAQACGRPDDAAGISRWIDLVETAAFLARGGEI